MQSKQIKSGEFYAYSSGSRTYGTPSRVKVLDTAHEFTRKVNAFRMGNRVTETVTETGILAVRVDENGEPLELAKPFRITAARYVWSTWADEEARREAQRDDAARAQRIKAERTEAALAEQALLLTLLGPEETPLRKAIAGARVYTGYSSDVSTYLDIPKFKAGDLISLLKQARTAALNEVGEE